MIDTKLRYKFQSVFDKIAKIFIYFKIKPNTITLFAFLIGIASGLFIAFNMLYIAILLLWISGILDVLDGSVARLTKNTSKIGAYMDLIFDRMVEAAIILGFAYLIPSNYFVYLIFFVAVIFNFTTFIVAGSIFQNTGNKSMHYDVGIAERTETFIVFTLMMLFSTYTFYILMAFNIIIFITGIIRFIKVIKYNKEKQ